MSIQRRPSVDFFSKVHENNKRNRGNNHIQYDGAALLSNIHFDKSQTDNPHHAIILTNKDLYAGNTNFVIGVARPDLGTVISLQRIWNSIRDPKLRNETIKTEIAHEVGHVYNLPSPRRGSAELDNKTLPGGGDHCLNPGCCMKQGVSVPKDFIKITQDRLRNLGDQCFCPDCHLDLQEKYKSKQTN